MHKYIFHQISLHFVLFNW